MKIYFEDGTLDNWREIGVRVDNLVDATCGFSSCKMALDRIRMYYNISSVYTNSLVALNNEYAWNDELGVPEIYIRNNNREFTRIDKLTNKALRKEHNIMKMYMAGSFRN